MTRTPPAFTAAAACLAAMLIAGCSSDPAGAVQASDVQIRFQISGGIAGIGYTILVDGRSGSILGESCFNGCSFESGDVLLTVTDAQVQAWADQLLDAGILALDGTDYGDECCDQFHVVLTFSDGLSEATVRGSAHLMPSGIEAVALELANLIHETLAVIVDPSVDLATLPMDPAQLLDASLGGSNLDLELSYGGGCELHAFALVSDGAFMESFPVQVRLVLAHDDRDDACDALVSRTLSFRLQPLEAAYAAAYPGEIPGERRLVIHVVAPGPGSLTLEHTF